MGQTNQVFVAFCATRPAITRTAGFEVFVQLVIAAIQTFPCDSLFTVF